VYRGLSFPPQYLRSPPKPFSQPERKAQVRRVAIKKIKVGQFKDGLDMSAIREVKYLRELSHPNVIEVRETSHPIVGCARQIPLRP
jgi:hypothetical protein